MISWVVGQGLLGANVERALSTHSESWRPLAPLRWRERDVLDAQFAAACAAFASRVGGQSWQVAWCAGAGVVASSEAELGGETRALARFLHHLANSMGGGPRGGLFLASSAGGVYAGSPRPPFTERSATHPLSAYGETKLDQEALALTWSQEADTAVLIGRIANLFGPGQDIAKPQGLISQLAVAMLTHRPITLYVPLDTMRDYLYAPDCARMIVAALDRMRLDRTSGHTVTKIFASGRGITISAVLAELKRVVRRKPRVSIASSPLARFQASDLRFRSEVWPDVDGEARTPFPAAVHALVQDLERRLRRGDLVTASAR